MGKVYIGTSGWQYSHWRGSFYPQDLPNKKWLSFYSRYFNTVEVNSSFYRVTKASTFQKWQKETPKDFIFAVKGNRFITHIKRLRNISESLKIFFDNVTILSDSHVILWQLPPSFKIDLTRLENFLKLLSITFRHAIEFRHESWVKEETWKVLRDFNIAAVFQDWGEWPIVREITANFIYIRFHGKDNLYASNYSDNTLKTWSDHIKKWRNKNYDIYAYFNNDSAGFAVPNARKLKKLASTI